MTNRSVFFVVVAAVVVCGFKSGQPIKYPVARKSDVKDTYFGVVVPDPYRWLENDNMPDAAEWIKNQNAVTRKQLDDMAERNGIAAKLRSLSNFADYRLPKKENGIYYFLKKDGILKQPVLYSQNDLKSEPQVFFDPNSEERLTRQVFGDIFFSKGSKYCAFTTTPAGSDWQTVYVMETATKKILSVKVDWLKLSSVSWKGDEGFYYSRFPEPKGNKRYSSQNRMHSVYYHRIGDPQESDKVVFEDDEHPYHYHFASVTEDDRFLILYTSEGTSASQIMIRDLKKGDDAPFKMVLEGFKYEAEVFDNDKKYLFVKTNVSAPRYRVVAVSVTSPFVNNWETMIPEQKDVLETIKSVGGSWFTAHLKDATSYVSQYTNGGFKLRDIPVPPTGSVTLFDGRMDNNEIFYSYSSFLQPETIYRLKVSDGKASIFKGSELSVDAAAYDTKQVFFNSEDGTKVPMFICHKKGLKLDGTNPVLMNAYGGFNLSLKPEFNVFNLMFIQQGGIYAQVNTRGGSEYGEKWHKAGMLLNKQKAFDDFIAGAEYLIDEKYTKASKIAAAGSGHAGLLVAACMVQRPELFKAVLPDAALLDMLRYEKFTVGYNWAGEYGLSDDRDEFDVLYNYSPLQNIKQDKEYPATLITAAAYDERVVPAHSYKFAATLQENQKGDNPILIRIQEADGFSSGARQLNKQTDRMTFIMHQLGM